MTSQSKQLQLSSSQSNRSSRSPCSQAQSPSDTHSKFAGVPFRFPLSTMSSMVMPLAALTFGAWGVYLGGLASLQSDCDVGGANPTMGLMDNTLPCSKAYRYSWFIMAWQIVIIMMMVGAAVMQKVAHMRLSLVGLFAVGTLLYMEASNDFLNGQSIDYYTEGTPLHRIRVITAGAIMTATMNAINVLVLGYNEMGADKAVAEKTVDMA